MKGSRKVLHLERSGVEPERRGERDARGKQIPSIKKQENACRERGGQARLLAYPSLRAVSPKEVSEAVDLESRSLVSGLGYGEHGPSFGGQEDCSGSLPKERLSQENRETSMWTHDEHIRGADVPTRSGKRQGKKTPIGKKRVRLHGACVDALESETTLR